MSREDFFTKYYVWTVKVKSSLSRMFTIKHVKSRRLCGLSQSYANDVFVIVFKRVLLSLPNIPDNNNSDGSLA